MNMRLKHIKTIIYSQWLSCFLGEVGENSCFHYPIQLQGSGRKRIRIGSGTNIQAHSILGCWEKYGKDHFEPKITIGDDCSIGEFCHITAINNISIGNGLLTGRFVYIGDNNHGDLSWENSFVQPAKRKLKSKGEIVIGNNVWIGDKTTILGGLTIGDNVIIGANSVVNHDIPSNSIAVGAPAKIIKQL